MQIAIDLPNDFVVFQTVPDHYRHLLTNPQRTETDSEDPALGHALGRIPEHGDRVLRVVYNKTVEPWRIVTVYFDRTQKDTL